MAKITLKDLRTAYRVLTRLPQADTLVPHALLVTLADSIKAEEKSRAYRKIARMSEEELIRHQTSVKRRLRINLPDGRIIQERTNEATFLSALREVDFAALQTLGLKQKGVPLFVGFDVPRHQLTGYKTLRESCFVLRTIKPADRISLLRTIDEALRLEWDIEML